MNKKIVQLREQRAAKVAEMEAITVKMEAEGRSVKDTEERTAWNNLKQDVENLEAELKDAEFAAERQLNIIKKEMEEDQENKENKELRKYDLAKAIREFKSGLTGFEKEIQEEGVNEYRSYGQSVNGIIVPEKVLRSFTKAGNTGHYDEVHGNVDVVADRGILSKLGVTVYDNLTQATKLVFSNGFNAAFYGEGAAEVTTAPTESTDKLDANRIQGSDKFSEEFLAQSATMPSLMADMMASIEAAAAKKILADIIATGSTTLTGYGSAATAKALTYKDILKLKGALKNAIFSSPKLVAGGELYAELEGTSKDAGAGRFVIENSKFNGYDAVDAMGLMAPAATKHSLVFGDFSRAYVGYFGGIEILIDPYTLADKGEVKLTYRRLGDVSFNPNAFKTIQNASISA